MKQTKDTQSYDVVVIGGGASGMIAAGRAAELGARVLVLEKNKQLGKKLEITGGGRCNIVNAEFNTRKLLENFPESKEFLYSSFAQFNAEDAIAFFEERGLPIVIESRKRAFPKSQNAIDVCTTLHKYMKEGGVSVRLETKVLGLRFEKGKILGIKTKKGEYQAHVYVLATGGFAAPETGSTGDGFCYLEELGHTIVKPNPNVVPLTSNTEWVHRLSGNSLSFMKIRFRQNGKILLRKTGKILFTHFGISGPLVLNLSHEVIKLLKKGKVEASIDMFPDTELDELDRAVKRIFEKNKNKLIQNVIDELVLKAIGFEILQMPNINLYDRVINSITKEERKKLVNLLKDIRFDISGTLGFDKAVIADGGVDLKEVNFKTMQSRLFDNLYLLGDILNVNRPSGGYSLQLCWTTGWVTASHIGKMLSERFAKGG